MKNKEKFFQTTDQVPENEPEVQMVQGEMEEGEPIEESVNGPETSQGESKSVEELLQLSDEELKQYGIDDPKQWKSYQRLLHKKENEWKQKEQFYEQTLQKLLQQAMIQQQPEPPKEEKVELPPVLPPKPANFDLTEAVADPNSESGRWYQQFLDYQQKVSEYNTKVTQELMRKITAEEEMKRRIQEKEQFKATVIANLRENGLEDDDAVGAYNLLEAIMTSDVKNGAKLLAKAVKGEALNLLKNKNINSALPKKPKASDFLPPGIESSGAVPGETYEKQFISEIKGGNKTNKILSKIQRS